MPFWEKRSEISLAIRCLSNLPITPPSWFSGAEVEMDPNVERSVVRSRPVSELVSVPAPRELVPTPIATRSADVSRAETTSSTVLRSHVRESRSSADKPKPESRPEVVCRPEMELTADVVAAPTSVRATWGH